MGNTLYQFLDLGSDGNFSVNSDFDLGYSYV